MADLNAFEIESAMSMIAGTARSMGITVTGECSFKISKRLDNGKIDKKTKRGCFKN